MRNIWTDKRDKQTNSQNRQTNKIDELKSRQLKIDNQTDILKIIQTNWKSDKYIENQTNILKIRQTYWKSDKNIDEETTE